MAYALLAVASAIALAFAWRDGTPNAAFALNPFGPAEASRRFFATNPIAIRAAGFFCFVSSIPLALYATTVVARLDSVGANRAGAFTALAGGLAASGGLAVAGLLLWLLSAADITTSLPLTHALHFAVLLSGGVAFAIGQGIMAAGLWAATRTARHLPAWVDALSLALAVTGLLSAFGLLSEPLTIAIPVSRVGGFVLLIGVAWAFRADTL